MKSVSKVLTANRLSDGIAVWLGGHGRWVDHIADAVAASEPAAIAALEAVAAETLAKAQHCDVVLIDVELTASGPRPLKLRERIRADGPTIRLDLGKQAGRPSASAQEHAQAA